MLLHYVYHLVAKKPTEPLNWHLLNGIRKPRIKNKAGSTNAAQHKNSSMNVICGKN